VVRGGGVGEFGREREVAWEVSGSVGSGTSYL
jgi:hypothetical protein